MRKNIILTGTLEEKELKKVYDGLAPKLQEKGISLELQYLIFPELSYSISAIPFPDSSISR